ncbi:hypothetical protein CFP56_009907 [Quercus suber]|uniref:Uncharacterized protein n=1 Tax=Quercus suber TaxID=58331 RepID=A0AAW0L3E8_QUESU
MAEKLIDKLTHAAHVGDNRGLEIFAACDDEILKQVLPHCTVDQLKAIERVGKLYEKEKERKQSRQVKVVTVVSNNNNNKRVRVYTSSEVPNLNKNNLMKKARKEFLNCLEVKNHQAINLQRKYHCH